MKDQNNNPITDIGELSCECGEGNLCPLHGRPYGISVEKTVEELFEARKVEQHLGNGFDEYPYIIMYGTIDEIISEVKQQVRREVVVEHAKYINEMSDRYPEFKLEAEIDDDGTLLLNTKLRE